MKKTLFLIIGSIFFALLSSVTFASSPTCPVPQPMIDLDREFDKISTDAKNRARECILARAENRESSIKDYVCPSGDFSEGDRPYTDEILAYQIAVATVFQAIDNIALGHAKSLQCMRQKDPIIWQQSNKVFTDMTSGYAAQYHRACNMAFIVRLLERVPGDGQSTYNLIQTSDVFPQYCKNLANAKVRALDNLATLLAGTAIGKSYQNDKDEFVTRVKGKYASLLEKSSRYFRTMSQAVAKIDAYLKTTIR